MTEQKFSLFKKAESESAYLKMGFYGSNGSGKTFTSALVAIGLHKHIKAKKPVFFLDSETGSDFVIPMFKEAKVDLFVAKSRSFSDLLDATKEAGNSASIMICDSISHFWDELVESYKKKKQLNRLYVQHWGELKPMWREFSTAYVHSGFHYIICGRVGDVWEEIMDDEGVKELKKTGTRMRTEKELGYEPSLLVEMEIARDNGKKWTHQAWIIKDRFNVLNFTSINNPTFESFLAHITLLNLGGKHRAFDEKDNTQALFNSDNTGYARMKKREQVLEEIKGAIAVLYPGQDTTSKTARLELMKETFSTRSWTKITDLKIEDLQAGLESIESMNENKDQKETKEKTDVEQSTSVGA